MVGGGGGGCAQQITAHNNPYSFSTPFSLSFFPLCIRRGFDKKFAQLYRTTIQPKTSRVGSARTVGHSKGKERKIITPKDDLSLRKYDDSKLLKNRGIPYHVFQTLVPNSMHNNHWYRIFLKLHSTTVYVGTWSKYNSAIQKLSKYCTLFQIPAK
jgi:hypothetical protein